MHFCGYIFHKPEDDPEELIAMYNETDEQFYEFEYDTARPISEVTQEDIDLEGLVLDDTGEFYGWRSNLNGYYDWYCIGNDSWNRWHDSLPLKNGKHASVARLGDIDISKLIRPSVYVDDYGDWHYLYVDFFHVATEKENDEFRKIASEFDENTIVTVVDFHD